MNVRLRQSQQPFEKSSESEFKCAGATPKIWCPPKETWQQQKNLHWHGRYYFTRAWSVNKNLVISYGFMCIKKHILTVRRSLLVVFSNDHRVVSLHRMIRYFLQKHTPWSHTVKNFITWKVMMAACCVTWVFSTRLSACIFYFFQDFKCIHLSSWNFHSYVFFAWSFFSETKPLIGL